jgi:hypothetical protein
MTLKEAVDCAVRVKRHRMEWWMVRVSGRDGRDKLTTWRCKDCFFTVMEKSRGRKGWPVPEPTKVCAKQPPVRQVDDRGRLI